MSQTTRCEALTRSGAPCKNPTGDGARYCWYHDPTLAAARADARSRGGKARHGRAITSPPGESSPVELNTPADVLRIVALAINDALAMERSLSRSRTLGSLALVALKCFETTELSERIAALEQRMIGYQGVQSGNAYLPAS